MLKRRIPEQYDFNDLEIHNIIHSILPGVPVEIKGRFVTIDANPTAPQLAQLKAAIVAALESVPDVTV